MYVWLCVRVGVGVIVGDLKRCGGCFVEGECACCGKGTVVLLELGVECLWMRFESVLASSVLDFRKSACIF